MKEQDNEAVPTWASECIRYANLFACKIQRPEVDACINFVERKKEGDSK